ncbi:MAG: hypothetical protein ACYDDZ_11170 [Acidimicrobiales bacterium]
MYTPVRAATTAVTTLVVAVLLTFAAVWGAAPATAAPLPSAKALTHFNCARAQRALTRIDRFEARIGAGLPKLSAAEAKAKATGHAKREHRLERRIRRLESTRMHDRLVNTSRAIENKCHVSAPAPATAPATPATPATPS